MLSIVLFLLQSNQCHAYTIETVAGGGIGDGNEAIHATLRFPRGICWDDRGNLYIADTFHHRIRRIDAGTGIITTVAGNGSEGFSGDGDLATKASLAQPSGIMVDKFGNLYIAESMNHRIRKVDAETQIITTIAGDGDQGEMGMGRFGGDGGLAINASLSTPGAIDIDDSGNLYIADGGNGRIRKIDNQTGIITTIAGNGVYDKTQVDGGNATEVSLCPEEITLTNTGEIFILSNSRIWKMFVDAGAIIALTGTGGSGSISADGTLANEVRLWSPHGLYINENGDIFFTEFAQIYQQEETRQIRKEIRQIRKIDRESGVIGTVFSDTSLSRFQVRGIIGDAEGNLIISDTGHHLIRKFDPDINRISTIAGGSIGDGGSATNASLSYPTRVYVDQQGDIFIIDGSSIRKVQSETNEISTPWDSSILGNMNINGIHGDDSGNLYIAYSCQISKLDTKTGDITPIAGSGSCGTAGDGGSALEAQLEGVSEIFLNQFGDIYIGQKSNGSRIRKIDGETGHISTIAGPGQFGISGDGGSATEAYLSGVSGIYVNGEGDVFFTDEGIRKIDTQSGIVTTIAGTEYFYPRDVFLDEEGNIYLTKRSNHTIGKIDKETGILTTIAGNGIEGFSGDGTFATNASMNPNVAKKALEMCV